MRAARTPPMVEVSPAASRGRPPHLPVQEGRQARRGLGADHNPWRLHKRDPENNQRKPTPRL